MTHSFKKNVIEKLVSTAISVKVWILCLILGISTWLLLIDKITGGDWVTVVVSSVTVIVVSREGFKMSMPGMNKKPKVVCPYARDKHTDPDLNITELKEDEGHSGMFI